MLEIGVKHGLDTLVFATGFDAMTGPLIRLNIIGSTGSLKDYWSAGPLSYLGLPFQTFQICLQLLALVAHQFSQICLFQLNSM